jgi:hypothetical protein
MALIHLMASAGSPGELAGRAAFSSMALVDMGVTGGGACGTGSTMVWAGGTALGLDGLGCRGTGAGVADGVGFEGCSSSSLVSSGLSPKTRLREQW